jgi:nickel transport protein
MMHGRLLAVALAAALAPTLGVAHEVLHDVERGKAVAVRAYESDGMALGDAQYEVFSPASTTEPYLRGRTDRHGWLAFVPDVAGAWRVRVVEGSGHGLDTTVDVSSGGSPSPRSAPAPGGAAVALRPLVGVVLIAAIFGALFALARRKARQR